MALCSYSKPLTPGSGVLGFAPWLFSSSKSKGTVRRRRCAWARGHGQHVDTRVGGVAAGKRNISILPVKEGEGS